MDGLRIFGFVIGWLHTITNILVAIGYRFALSTIETEHNSEGESCMILATFGVFGIKLAPVEGSECPASTVVHLSGITIGILAEHSVASIFALLIFPIIVAIISAFMIYGIWKNQHKYILFWMIFVPLIQAIRCIMILVTGFNIFSVSVVTTNSGLLAAIVYFIYRLHKQVKNSVNNKGRNNSKRLGFF